MATKERPHLKVLDSYSEFDEQLLPLVNRAGVDNVRELVRYMLEESPPELTQDARYWLASAIQRDLIDTDAHGVFFVTDAGLQKIK